MAQLGSREVATSTIDPWFESSHLFLVFQKGPSLRRILHVLKNDS